MAAAVLLYAALWLGPTFGNLTARKKWVLKFIRGLVFGILLICFLRPGWVITERKPQTAVLSLLVDISRSMELAHDASGSSRFDALKKVLIKNQAKIQELKKQNIELKVSSEKTMLTEHFFSSLLSSRIKTLFFSRAECIHSERSWKSWLVSRCLGQCFFLLLNETTVIRYSFKRGETLTKTFGFIFTQRPERMDFFLC